MKLQRKDCHHVAHRLTFKVQGKTCIVYVPLDRVKDVETWTKEYKRLTGRLIDLENAWKVAAAARLRWRCENEGFNVLKNGGFALEHVYSHNPVASKCYFMLMLIAHIFQQLLTRGRLNAVFEDSFHTFRHYGKKMLEALMNQPLPANLNPPQAGAAVF